jgi:hypothetical protein
VVAFELDSHERRHKLRKVSMADELRQCFGAIFEPQLPGPFQRPPVRERERLVPGNLNLAEEDVSSDVAGALELLEELASRSGSRLASSLRLRRSPP